MDVKSINLSYKNQKDQEIEFVNTGRKINFKLPKTFTRKDTLNLQIKYVSNPEDVTDGGSSAISMAKGLYFINPNNKDENKPQQIWTQGETEANSVWFPTIDNPVEKTTQEMYITVDDRFKTLSNGELIFSSINEDGTRTDYWKMDKPHSPYLFMMAIGEFAIVKDSWKRKNGEIMDVHYYVSPEYKEHAMAMFGKTPKMLGFFSDLLGFEYPWSKYHQVVVQDYVSGAMENTTATIHGDFLHQTKREIIDGGNESIIAHELFHHWFGDLVTCESWSNLPLNESFANYSQFLWDEFEYGKMQADMNAYQEMEGYFLSAQQGGYKDLIRFDYNDKEDMFDGHSYNKGGRILNMLRDHVGDDAFFDGLKLYLNKHAFKTAEAHDLRIAFEEVSGLDLNWFFNQWFFAKGHPILEIKQQYINEQGLLQIMVHQKQDTEKWPLYSLPIHIDVYTNTGTQTQQHWISNKWDTINIELANAPLLVNVDAHKTLLCKKTDKKNISQWIHQLQYAPLWLDKKEAFDQLGKSNDSAAIGAIIKNLNHSFWNVRYMAISKIENGIKIYPENVKNILISLSLKDVHPKVRAASIKALAKYYPYNDDLREVFDKALLDPSYRVISEVLKAVVAKNSTRGLDLAMKFEQVENATINQTVAAIYADYGDENQRQFFVNTINELTGFNKYSFLQHYLAYVIRQNNKVIDQALPIFEKIARNGNPWYLKLSGYQILSAIQNHHANKANEYQLEIEDLESDGKLGEATVLESKLKEENNRATAIDALLKELRDEETDENVLKYIR
jgi:aminopeptidase N